MSTVRKVSKRAGVSVATVSRVLNNHEHVNPKTRQKVLAAMELTGYIRAVSRRATTVIGLAYAGDLVHADYGGFDAAILAGMLQGASESRFDVNIVSVRRDRMPDESYSQFFDRKGLRGVILRCQQDSRHVCEAIGAEGFPAIVVADRFDHAPSVNYLCCDSRSDTERAVEHLIALGHQRIALGIHRVPDTDHNDRRAGYESVLRRARLGPDPSLLVEIQADMEGGAGLVTRLLSLPEPPTALLLTDPLASIGALRRCLEIGLRVPSEFSIVGFDDSDIRTHTFPRLTAVVQDANMLGLEAARALIALVEGRETNGLRRALPTRLEINGSTSSAPLIPVRVLPDGSRVTLDPGRAARSRRPQSHPSDPRSNPSAENLP